MAILIAVGLIAVAPITAQATTYPPATTGTFAFTARDGANSLTVHGLDENEKATGIISGSGVAPTFGTVRAGTATVDLGQTTATGDLTFAVHFPSSATGVYNMSILTPGGASVSGYVSISGTDLPNTGTYIATWIVWISVAVVILGLIVVITTVIRRHRSSR